MRILICGDRHWVDRDTIREYLMTLPKDTLIIEGEAAGADSIAREEAEKLGLLVWPFNAEWDKYGRAAGPIRNRRMLEEGNPSLVVAFHHNLAQSTGTKNCVQQAIERGIKVKLIAGKIFGLP